ncbi:NAD-dependent epimerase/dehydratase [Streptomyces himastatinicus ATCC 53653]|uniref:NAD-dependent epimerase/dehydratase n=2 Tax=Streptomyces violaceusniger group TaxID=2839105 RepID=D9WL46_9ACTN|nr:NAD-dependent epimerase/dehydratase family protein [Streptomyces himastatinicus]EFL29321.1 NAD-dependent epimerase/dehydratase [Streptomyces himastatinicus ATCC 53653]
MLGSVRVFEAVAAADVPALEYASSVGAYSPGRRIARSTSPGPPMAGQRPAYTRGKAYVERFLDSFEQRHPDLRVVRMRPGFLFQRSAEEPPLPACRSNMNKQQLAKALGR